MFLRGFFSKWRYKKFSEHFPCVNLFEKQRSIYIKKLFHLFAWQFDIWLAVNSSTEQ